MCGKRQSHQRLVCNLAGLLLLCSSIHVNIKEFGSRPQEYRRGRASTRKEMAEIGTVLQSGTVREVWEIMNGLDERGWALLFALS